MSKRVVKFSGRKECFVFGSSRGWLNPKAESPLKFKNVREGGSAPATDWLNLSPKLMAERVGGRWLIG